jgi:hypothetical protein
VPQRLSAGPAVSVAWSADELGLLDAAVELEIAVRRGDGSLRPWVPIWVVCADGQTYVRTWYRRDTGWFGHALEVGRGRIRVPGLETDVRIEPVRQTSAAIDAAVDAAYVTKYGEGGAASMVTPEATATTLRLVREDDGRAA